MENQLKFSNRIAGFQFVTEQRQIDSSDGREVIFGKSRTVQPDDVLIPEEQEDFSIHVAWKHHHHDGIYTHFFRKARIGRLLHNSITGQHWFNSDTSTYKSFLD